MNKKKQQPHGLDNLLDLDGEVFPMESRCEMKIRVMKVGVISRDEYRQRTIAIAKGEYKPKKDEPKIWFESLNSMAQILSSENQKLLKIILEHKPHSLVELERLSSRNKSNLSRTLKTLERYGVVELPMKDGKLVPKVKATDFKVEFGLNYSNPVPKQSLAGV